MVETGIIGEWVSLSGAPQETGNAEPQDYVTVCEKHRFLCALHTQTTSCLGQQTFNSMVYIFSCSKFRELEE